MAMVFISPVSLVNKLSQEKSHEKEEIGENRHACTTFALRILEANLLILLVAVQGFEPRTLRI
jgi:hypothetical protein